MDSAESEAKNNRLAAFDAIVSTYEQPLLRYAARILHDNNGAQDVVQDAFLSLFRNWEGEMAPSPHISNWLYRVTHNRAVDYLRHESRRQILHQRHSEEQDDVEPPNRGRDFQISDAAARAAAALRTLSLREQQLVLLKVYEQKSYKEISEVTGLTVTNVGYILHYAMKKLATNLKDASHE